MLINKLLRPNMQVGWASTMVAIFFFAGVILFFLGLIGEYIGRMFLSMGNAPQYVVREVHRKTGDRQTASDSCQTASGDSQTASGDDQTASGSGPHGE